MARNTEKLGTCVPFAAELIEPACSTTNDGRCYSDSFDIGDCTGAAEKTNGGREWGLQTRLSRLALQGFNEGSLLTADIGAHPAVQKNVKVVAGAASVLTEKAGLICLLNSTLQNGGLMVELAADVDVCGGALGEETRLALRTNGD